MKRINSWFKSAVALVAFAFGLTALADAVDPLQPEGSVKVTDGFYQNATTYSAATEFYITNLNGLKYFRDLVNENANGSVNAYIAGGFWTLSVDQFYTYCLFDNKTVNLLADIDLNNEEWEPIGNAYDSATNAKLGGKPYFYGRFDGHNHTVSNLKFNNTDYHHIEKNSYRYAVGLFGYMLGTNGIQNLTIENVDITGQIYIGALVGHAPSAAITITNCHIRGSIAISGTKRYIGGIAGHAQATFRDCSVEATTDAAGTISASSSGTGGICGYSAEAADNAFAGCVVKNMSITGTSWVGGIAGHAGDGVTITDATLTDVTVTGTSETNVGRLIGLVEEKTAATPRVPQILDTVASNLTATGGVGEVLSAWGTFATAGANGVCIVGKDVKTIDDAAIAEGNVIGGTFESLPDAYLASGYAKVDNGDGTWTVQEKAANVARVIVGTVTNEYETVEKAVAAYNDATVAGDYLIEIYGGTYALSGCVLEQSANKSLTIRPRMTGGEHDEVTLGYGGDSTSVFKIDGVSDYNSLPTVISHFNFDLSAKPKYGIELMSNEGRYASHLTVSYCSFVGESTKAVYGAGAASGSQPSGITFDHCTAQYLGWFWTGYINETFPDALKFTNCTVRDCKYFIGIDDGAGDVTVDNCDVEVYGGTDYAYAIRLSAGASGVNSKATITRSSFKVGGASGDQYAIFVAWPKKANTTKSFYVDDYTAQHLGNYTGERFCDVLNRQCTNEAEANVDVYRNGIFVHRLISTNTQYPGSRERFNFNTLAQIVSADGTVTNGFDRLQLAFDYVQEDETIEVLADNSETITVTNTCAFTFKSNGYTLGSAPSVPEGYAFVNNGDGTCTYGVAATPVAEVTVGETTTKYTSLSNAFANATAAGATVKLLADVDLAGENWRPVNFCGTFDGNNKVISNLTVTNYNMQYVGFFSEFSGVAKNVTFTGADVSAWPDQGRAGVFTCVADSKYLAPTTISNVTVAASTVRGTQKCAGLVGFIRGLGNGYYDASIDIIDCVVSNVTLLGLTGNGMVQTGGLVGNVGSGTTINIISNTVSDITVDDKAKRMGYDVPETQYACHAFMGVLVNGRVPTDSYTWGVATFDGNTTDQCPESMVVRGRNYSEFIGDYANWDTPISTKKYLPTKLVVDGYEVTLARANVVSSNGVTTNIYATLQAAFNAVQDDQTIEVLANNSETITVTNTCSFTFKSNGYTLGSAPSVPEGYAFVNNGDGTCTYGVAANYVAQIGSKKYETFAEALADARAATTAEGKTITVIGTVNGQNINGDNEGITIQGSETGKFTAGLSADGNEATTSLKNVTLRNLKFEGCGIVLSLSIGDVSGMLVEGCTFDGTGNLNDMGFQIMKSSQIKVDGLTFRNNTFRNYMGTSKSGIILNGAAPADGGKVTIVSNLIENVTFNGMQLLNFAALDVISNRIVNVGSWAVLHVMGSSNMRFVGNELVMNNANNENSFSQINSVVDFYQADGNVVVDTNGVTLTDAIDIARTMWVRVNDGGLVAVDATKDDDGKYTAGHFFGSLAKLETLIADGCQAVAVEGYANEYIVEEIPNFYQDAQNPNLWHIRNVAGLREFRDSVDAGTLYAGKTVRLDADVDLGNEDWNPIGEGATAPYYEFAGTFDGQNHTISNLFIDGKCDKLHGVTAASGKCVGLFAATKYGSVISNLTICNVTMTNLWRQAGALIGGGGASEDEATISHVNVTGLIQIGDAVNYYEDDSAANYVGGILGKGYSRIDNCTVVGDEGSYIKSSNWYIGGIAGFIGENLGAVLSDCTVSNVHIAGHGFVGGIVGIVHYGNTVANCTVTADVIVENYAADDKSYINKNSMGGIAGITDNGDNGETSYITNNVFAGTLIRNGVTLEPTDDCLHNDGIVGVNRSAYSEATIDQTNVTVADNTSSYELPRVAQVTIGGVTTRYASLAAALTAAKGAGAMCELLSDVDLTGKSWTPIADFCGTFDGKGYTISGLQIDVTGGDVGLFGNTKSPAFIKNVTLESPSVTGTGIRVGALVGYGFQSSISNVTVTGATVTGKQYVGGILGGTYCDVIDSKVLNSTVTGEEQVGGAVGYSVGASVSGCTATNNTIEATSERAGGLIGKLQIGDSGRQYYDNNMVSGTVTAPDMAGGIAAQIMGGDGDYEIRNNEIDVTLSATAKNPIGNLRDGQDAAFTEALAANITGNWWEDKTLNADSFQYANVGTGVALQTIYRGVAKIGGTCYKTLAAAFEAVPEGGAAAATIKLIADIDLVDEVYEITNKNILVDGQDHTITASISDTVKTAFLYCYDGARLDIADATFDISGYKYGICYDCDTSCSTGTLTRVTVDGDGVSVGASGEGTVLTLNECAIIHAASDIMAAVYADSDSKQTAVAAMGKATVNVNEGTVVSDKYGVYVFTSAGTINVDDAMVTAPVACKCDSYSVATSVVNVISGTIDGTMNLENNWGAAEGGSHAVINLMDGKFSNFSWTVQPASWSENVKLLLTGGVYDADPTDVVAPGYMVVDNISPRTRENYPFKVVLAPVAQVIAADGAITNEYTTLQAAFDAVEATETILMLRDNAEDIVVTKTVPFYFNANGHALAGTVPTAPAGWQFVKVGDICTLGEIVPTSEETEAVVITAPQTASVDTNEAAKVIFDPEVVEKIGQNTVVTGVKLSPTNEEHFVSGAQSVVAEAKETGSVEFKANLENGTNVIIQVDVEVKPTEYTAPEEEKTEGAIKFSLKPIATVTIDEGGDNKTNTVDVTNEMIDQLQDIAVTVYTGFKPVQAIHTDKDGNKELFAESEIGYDPLTGNATIIVHHFSDVVFYEESKEFDGVKVQECSDGHTAKEVTVPGYWLRAYGVTDDVATNKTITANGLPAWKSFVLGLDPNETVAAGNLQVLPQDDGTVDVMFYGATGEVQTDLVTATFTFYADTEVTGDFATKCEQEGSGYFAGMQDAGGKRFFKNASISFVWKSNK